MLAKKGEREKRERKEIERGCSRLE